MTNFKQLFAICFCLLSSFLSSGQSTVYQEKVMLHLDRNYYVAGDTLRFKAYVTEGFANTLQPRSNVFHLSISDDSGKVISDQIYLIEDGQSYGSMYLPDTLKKTTYQVNGYTNWMKNEGKESFARIKVPIFGRGSVVPNRATQKNYPKVIVQSRSGELVEGRPDQINVWLTDHFEDQPSDSLELRHTEKGLIDKVAVGKDSYHSFSVVPEKGFYIISYVRGTYIDSDDLKVLGSPVAPLLGVVTGQGIRYYIQTPTAGLYKFVMSFSERVVFEQELAGKTNYQLIMPRGNLIPGRIAANILDQSQNIIGQYQIDYKPYQFQLSTKSDTVAPGQEVWVNVLQNDTVSVSGSMSVFKLSECFDRVDPAFYVTNASNEVQRSSDWRNVFIGIEDTYATEVIIPNGKREVSISDRYLIEKDFLGLTAPAVSTSEEAIFYALLGAEPRMISRDVQEGMQTLVPQPVNHFGGKGYFSSLSAYPQLTSYEMPPFAQQKVKQALFFGVEDEQIKELLQETLQNRAVNFHYRNQKGTSEEYQVVNIPQLLYPDQSFTMKDYVDMRDFNEFDYEILADLRTRKKGDDYFYFIEEKDPYTGETKGLHKKPALVLLNGVVVQQHGVLGALPFSELDSIFLNYDPLDFDGLEVGGVLQLFTKRPFEIVETYLGVVPFDVPAMNKNQPYAINYQVEDQAPIVSQTLLWEPDLKFSYGTSQQFAASDVPGRYLIVFQGITSDGQPISLTKSIVIR